ncbi:MAG: hypothetical protein AAFY83_03955 [Pseudomonadota bacterium]
MTDKPSFSNDEKTSDRHLFQKGHPGGPGRPKGSRNKLGEAFLADLNAAWEREGPDAIQRVIRDKPDVFLKVVAALVPRQLDINAKPVEAMTDDEIADRLRELSGAMDGIQH